MLQRRPKFDLLTDNPKVQTNLAHDFQAFASEAHSGFDALHSAIGQDNAGMAGSIPGDVNGLLSLGNDLAAGSTALDALGGALNALDPATDLATSLAGESAFSVDLDTAIASSVGPDIGDFGVTGFPGLPPSSAGLLPVLQPPSQPASGPGSPNPTTVLWQIALGAKILSIPLTASAAAWAPGAGVIAGLPGGTVIASFLPIISAVALGALLPLEILSLFFGINPFSDAASDDEIASIKAAADTALTALVSTMSGALKHAHHPPESEQEATFSYNFAFGFLQNATCYVLGYTDPREYQWQADWLTKIAQAWVTGYGSFPPAVTCKGQS